MLIIKSAATLARSIEKAKSEGVMVGFVPTMGALHMGHIFLVESAKKENGLVLCSIYVNPTQFNDANDFAKYPKTIESDINMLEQAGCDILFLPETTEIYPADRGPAPHYDIGYLETILEGQFRPGHYQGVCQVVDRLLHIVQPHRLYLGQKDYQQCMVLKKLVQLIGMDTEVVICQTIRQPDGLAMSSRNLRLDPEERIKALHIYQALEFIKREVKPGYLGDTKERARAFLEANGFSVDYVEVADATNLQIHEFWDGSTPLVILIAAWLNEIRLIDNCLAGQEQ